MDKILIVNNMDFSYDDNFIFENLSFYLQKNTVNYIIGHNNCGKTTLIKLLSGVLPSFNCIKIDNILLNHKNLNRYVKSIGVGLFENKNQFLFDDVIKEMTFPLENLYLSKRKIFSRVDEVLTILNMKSIKYKKTSELSPLEKNKLIIGLAIIHKPKVILLDNPYIGLNKRESNIINRCLKSLSRKENIACLITTNDLENIVFGDKVIVLDNKNILLEGSYKDILKQDNILVRSGINIPVLLDLSIKLSEYDLLDKVVLDSDRMVDALWK